MVRFARLCRKQFFDFISTFATQIQKKTENELFYLTIKIGDLALHQVICNVPLESGTKFKLTMEDENPIIIFDLIFPVFDEYKKFIEGSECVIIHCKTLANNNKSMNYYQ